MASAAVQHVLGDVPPVALALSLVAALLLPLLLLLLNTRKPAAPKGPVTLVAGQKARARAQLR